MIIGVQTTFKVIKGFEKKIIKAEMSKMKQATMHVRSEMIKTLTGTRTGKTYKKAGQNVTYTASAPGEAPASPTGQLRGSIKEQVGRKRGNAIGEVGIADGQQAKKGFALELGTEHIEPRPWMGITFQRTKAAVIKILRSKWL